MHTYAQSPSGPINSQIVHKQKARYVMTLTMQFPIAVFSF